MANNVNGVAQQLDKLKIDKSDSGPALNADGTIDFSVLRMRFHRCHTTDLQEALPAVNSALEKYGYSCELDLDRCYIKFSATKTMGPNVILKSRCLIRILAAGVPARRALKVLNGIPCDLIYTGYHIGGMCSIFGITQDKYDGRRKLLMSLPVQELEELTGCDIYLRPNNHLVVAIGSSIQALKLIRRIVEDCIVRRMPPAPRVRRLVTYVRMVKGLQALRL